jgi:hypothetical protein
MRLEPGYIARSTRRRVMNPERSEQVSEVLDKALRLPIKKRSVYLAGIAARAILKCTGK